MKTRRDEKYAASGSVLILCLWVLLFLAAIAIAIGSQVSMVMRVATDIRGRSRCVDLVMSGAECAIAQVCLVGLSSATNAPELFKENGSMGEGVFSVSWEARTGKGIETVWGVQPESAKINLNVAGAQELASLLVEKAELDKALADGIAACVVDWRDGDDDELTGGAEASYYLALAGPYPCHNAKFDVAEELMLVKGMTTAIFSRIRPHITVYDAGAFGGRVVGRAGRAAASSGDASGVWVYADFVCDDKGRKLYWYEY
jgi:hypothetical protein